MTTGHRDADGPQLRDDVWRILKKAYDGGFRRLVTGMARGCDQLVAEVALELGYRVVAAIPCLGQEHKWSDFDRRRYWKILSHPSTVAEYVSDEPWSKRCFFARNFWMARFINSDQDRVLAFRARKKSGTQHCINACRKEGIENIIIFNPETREFE